MPPRGDESAGPWWRAGGLLAALKHLLASFSDITRTRLEILGIELQEEGARLRRVIVLAVLALFFFVLGVLLATLFLVALFWETHGLQVLGGFAVLYLLVAAILVLVLRHGLRDRPRPFSATVSELRKDFERLSSKS